MFGIFIFTNNNMYICSKFIFKVSLFYEWLTGKLNLCIFFVLLFSVVLLVDAWGLCANGILYGIKRLNKNTHIYGEIY